MVQLQALELRTGAQLLVTHIAWTQMIHQGPYGVSRGSLKEGVCLEMAMLAYFPWGLALSARSPAV